jgi:hypothetical protein
MNLLGRAAVREDKGNGFLSGRRGSWFRHTWRDLVGIRRQIRRRRAIIGLGSNGRRTSCVIAGVIAKVTGVSQSHNAIGHADSVRRDVGPAIAP